MAAVLTGCASVVTGCKRGASPAAPPQPAAPPTLGGLTIKDRTPEGGAPALDTAAFQQALRARLMATGLFAAAISDARPPGPVVRVRGDVVLDGAEVADKGVARAAVRIRFDSQPSDAPGAIEEELGGQGEQVYAIPAPVRGPRGAKGQTPAVPTPPSPVDKNALFAKLALRVAGDLIDGFAARERLRTGTPAQIHAALRADAGELQEQAIRAAGDRKLRDEVPTLLQLLDDQSESVRDAALGALIQIGDRRAVTALAKSRSLRDRREMRKILEAIATLGGDEALDYLSFVAQSHDDEEIRELATTAKARLERRMKDASTP